MEEELEIFERDALELVIESSKGSSRKNLNLNFEVLGRNKSPQRPDINTLREGDLEESPKITQKKDTEFFSKR